MMRLVLALALLLAGCAGGGAGLPPGGAAPPPAPIDRPGVLAFAADWTPPLHAAMRCGGPGLLSPFACDLPADAVWGVLPQAGGGGMGCVDPQPNECFQPADGVLNFHSGRPGMALVSARTFDGGKPISVEAVVNVTNDCSDVSFMGPVIYGGGVDDGDPTGTYIAAYISCTAPSDPVKLWIYRPTYAGPVNSIPVPPGTHAVRIDYIPGQSFTILLNRVVQLVITPGSLSNDALLFPHDPHAALWFGGVDGHVGRFDVFTEP